MYMPVLQSHSEWIERGDLTIARACSEPSAESKGIRLIGPCYARSTVFRAPRWSTSCLRKTRLCTTVEVVDEQFAEINGHQLRYRLEGDGPLAVFGHGLLGRIEQVYEENAGAREALTSSVRLLLYDARGHGESAGPAQSAGYTWESMGRDMSALAAHAGDGRAIFGGASMGAATALWVALEQPEFVRALVLVMPPPLGHEPMRAAAEKQAIQVLDLLSHAVENFGLEKTIELAKAFPGFAATPEEAEERASWLRQQNPLALLHAIRGLVQSPFHDPEEYRRINVPTLVIAHEGVGLHPVRAAQLLADTIPNCRLVVGSDAAYWRNNSDEMVAEIHGFLARVG